MKPSHRLALALAAIPFAIHLAALNNYGFFRDELYFIVCGRHPAFGYVDQPPLAPFLAALSQAGGESLWLMRLIPALFHVGAVIGACALARLLGGGRSAQIIAGVCVGLCPVDLALTATLGTTSLEPLSWTIVAYAALRAVLRAQPRWWLIAGIAGGIALEDKYTIAFLLAAIVAGLAVAGPREVFRQRIFWAAAACAVGIALPNLLWQMIHGWPFLEVLHDDAVSKNVALAPPGWILQQLLMNGPVAAPVWLAGIVGLMGAPRTRFLGVAVGLLFAAFIAMEAKDYYLAGLYPMLFAGGSVLVERLIRPVAVRSAYAGAIGMLALPIAPLAMPLLSEQHLIAYRSHGEAFLGAKPVETSERYAPGLLPQYFADMHGWTALADRVMSVERTLTPEERAGAAIFTTNYGEASAIDVLADGSVPVISGHNNFYLWGPHGDHSVMIFVGGRRAQFAAAFADVRLAGTVADRYARPDEIGIPIFVARRPRSGLVRRWPHLRHYD